MYLHELGDGAGSFTKDDMQAGLDYYFSSYWNLLLNYEFFYLIFCDSLLKLMFSSLSPLQETSRIWATVNSILLQENVSFQIAFSLQHFVQ